MVRNNDVVCVYNNVKNTGQNVYFALQLYYSSTSSVSQLVSAQNPQLSPEPGSSSGIAVTQQPYQSMLKHD